MTFPQYRKLDGFHRYYQITDDRTFIEVSVINGKISRTRIEAKQYPEMLRIKDMLDQQWNYRNMSEDEIGEFFPETA